MISWFADPFQELEALRDELFRTFDSYVPVRTRAGFLPGVAARSYPLLNVSEEPEAVHVQALAPGVDPKSLEVSVVGSRLTLSGEKTASTRELKADAWHRNERAAGRFVRTIDLPAEVDPGKVEAVYRNGILELALPKAPEARPRKISVKVG